MRELNGKKIVPVRRGGLNGHVLRSHSGVKIAAYYGSGSLERAISHALGRRDGGRSSAP